MKPSLRVVATDAALDAVWREGYNAALCEVESSVYTTNSTEELLARLALICREEPGHGQT